MILIAAAALMTGASVYGVVDYNRKSGNSDFKNLYREENATKTEVTPATRPDALEKVKKEAVSGETVSATVKKEKPVKKTTSKKKKISYKAFSRAEPREIIVEK